MWHPDMPDEYKNQIITGDAKQLATRIPDESVDLIFTDPPYPREFLPLYGWMAGTAARVLKPGGLCITLLGHYQLPDVLRAMEAHLEFYWVGGMLHSPGTVARMFSKPFMCGWKPMLWFSKGKPNNHPYVFDCFRSLKMDKQHHEWGQAAPYAEYYINKLTTPGAVVYDPFTGGGTVPAVCKMLGRHYVASEIDPTTAERARQRVRDTQTPLLVVEPEQLPLAV